MAQIGSRLRDERLRIGLSQDEFASVGGVARRSQSAYESDERSPDADYLLAVREIGVDICYVLTGERHQAEDGKVGDDADEAELIESYRSLTEAGKSALQVFLATCMKAPGMSATSTPRRAKRLAENRRAMFDQRTAENVERAKLEIERLRRERADKAKNK
ncbi:MULTISPECIES: helix-turn-helix domain-containing protein [Burkholderiaceae]|uniref:helix-turn-helix domain-containing protein n=1 Tax=Burkholderiaceae TaxID=119060 RepID=UPI00095D443C|nr:MULTISPECIES: helix-turn-helix domain-containing protein [Burkholderiaceae]MCG1038157.1 helix-turn-helix domain-containing protein [Mycetohabitans sp. B7]SIT76412.1 Helix-turn-helix domain-containing protein [Burkholderia sp. b14]